MGSIDHQSFILADLARLSKHPPEDPKLRKDLYNAALELVHETESAQDTAQRLYHGHVPLAMAQTGNDLGLFTVLAAAPLKQWTAEELATRTSADPVLMQRILNCLAAYGMARQGSDGKFSASNITRHLAEPTSQPGIKHYSLTMTPAYNAIPKFLAETGYRNPSASAPFNLAYKTDQSVFEWRKYNPENAKAGQAFMAAQRMGQQSIWEGNRVPLSDLRLSENDLEANRVLFVDVGGGFGHQCIDLRRLNPDLKGHMITQDLPLVHNMLDNKDDLKALDIEPMTHDFMEPQPVQGAKAYYLRNVIHNWNDTASELILKQVRQALAEDSVVMIDDVVMPQARATWKQASMDIAMMTMLAATERTEEQFRELLLRAGLELRDVWTYDDEYGDSLLIAVPV
ncbi:hypothetical protein Q7P37_003767 [Cladosporium fusiforme]